MDDIKQLKCVHLNDLGIDIAVTTRFGSFDQPARSAEAGNNVSGHHKCPCGIHCNSFADLDTCLQASVRDLTDSQAIYTAGVLHESNAFIAPWW